MAEKERDFYEELDRKVKEERLQGCLTTSALVVGIIAGLTHTLFAFFSLFSIGEYPEGWLLVIPTPFIWIGVIMGRGRPILGGLVCIALSLFIFLSPVIGPELSEGEFASLVWMIIWFIVCIPLLLSGIIYLTQGVRQRLSHH